MSGVFDPYWRAAAEHVLSLAIDTRKVAAPWEFEPLLPGCVPWSRSPGLDQIDAMIVHKGRLAEVARPLLAQAFESFVASFANEVFVVLSRTGTPVPQDNQHLNRDALLAQAMRHPEVPAAAQGVAPADAPVLPTRQARMAATYVGEGRVLIETAFGHLMLVDGRDTAIAPHLIRDGWFDRNVTLALGSHLRPGMVFMDVGANFGTYSLVAAACVGDSGRVIAVEPAPALADLAFENLTMNGFGSRSEVLRYALADSDGTQILYEFRTRQGSNTLHQHVADAAREKYGEAIHTREVPCRTLDGVVRDLALAQIDLVKIDVEGFEYQVLSGAQAMLRENRPKILLEWHSDFFAGRLEDAHALHHMLTEEFAYRLHRIGSEGAMQPVDFDALMDMGHSDVLALPAQ